MFSGLLRGAVILAVVLADGMAAAHDKNNQAAPSQAPPPAEFPVIFGGPFNLTDHLGNPRTDRDFRGRFMLVYFGYVNCLQICPTDLQTIADALDLAGKDAVRRVQPIFITVDPVRDRAAALGEFVRRFHPRLIGLAGTEAQIRAAAKAYRIHRRKVLTEVAPDGYLMSHTPMAFLMGPGGGFVTLFPHDTKAEKMAAVLRRHAGRPPAN